ncbi:MAG: hypothetical protein Q8L68_02255 [Methylococcales bacterium]|nr:hypothetical protein [Methylococcales bacterium]
MKTLFKFSNIMIFVCLLFVSCSGQEPSKTEEPAVSESATPMPTPTLVPLAPPSISPGSLPLPPIYIAIDESTSMKKDNCDVNYYRYKVPSFLLNVVKSLGDEFKPIDGSPTPNLMLMEGAKSTDRPRLVSGDDAIIKIKTLIEVKDQRSFENHPFIPVLDEYKSNLSQSSQSILFFFTDGDFTGLKSVNPKTLANDVIRQFRDIHTEFPNAKIHIFIMCAGRFENALSGIDYSDIKDTWKYISTSEYATVHGLGLDQDKMISNDSEKGTFLKQLLETVFRDQGWPENSDPSPENNWGWGFQNQEIDRFVYLYPPTVRLKYDMVSFDENAAHPSVLLDGSVLDRSFVPPAKECGLHEFRITNSPPLTFYWWQADIPQFSLENLSWQLDDPRFSLAPASSPIVFYNEYPSSINVNIVLKSMWDKSILPNTSSLLNYSQCMTFQARVNGGDWTDMDSSGKFILANHLRGSPNELINIEYRSMWDEEIQTNVHTSSAQARYFPEYRSGSMNSNLFGASNVKFMLAFDFLAEDYYPQGHGYHSNSRFTDDDCQNNSPGSGPITHGFTWDIESSRQEATVELFLQGKVEEWKKCENFEINHTSNLPAGVGWIDPDKIKVMCKLNWSKDTTGVMLDSIECRQGEK